MRFILRTKSKLLNTDFESTLTLYSIMLFTKVFFNVFPVTGFWTFVEM